MRAAALEGKVDEEREPSRFGADFLGDAIISP